MIRPLRTPLLLAQLALLPLGLSSVASAEPVIAKREDRQVVFRSGDRVLARYQAEPGDLPRPDIKEIFRRGGYLHSVRTLSGREITDDYPANHVHHHGMWMAWTKTVFEGREPDFWNMGQGLGRVEFVSLDGVRNDDAGAAELTTRHRYVDLIPQPPVTALNEVWNVSAHILATASRPAWALDLTATQTCAGNAPLQLPTYHYGGLGFRGNTAWDGSGNLKLLTSEGVTDRVKANTSRVRWCWLGGDVDGATAGVAILSHPDNFRAPQPIRVHPSEPFFCYAPQQAGDMSIQPGETYTVRYRFVIADGEPTAKEIDAWWDEWVKPE